MSEKIDTRLLENKETNNAIGGLASKVIATKGCKNIGYIYLIFASKLLI